MRTFCLSVCPFALLLQNGERCLKSDFDNLFLNYGGSPGEKIRSIRPPPQGAVGVVPIFSNGNIGHVWYHSKAMAKGYNFTIDICVLGPHPQQIRGVVEENGAKWDFCIVWLWQHCRACYRPQHLPLSAGGVVEENGAKWDLFTTQAVSHCESLLAPLGQSEIYGANWDFGKHWPSSAY